MLIADKNEDLQRMYSLVKRIPKGLEEMKNQMELHIAHQGAAVIESCGEDVVNNPKPYVQSILEVHGKYSTLMKTAFDSDSRFVASLDKASQKLINQNSPTKIPNSSRKSLELLASYCDSLLKKSPHNPEEAELEKCLDQFMTLFKYIDDKDVFETYYREFYCQRLIYQTSASDDAEAYMITALKNAYDLQYTSKLERMFKDITVAKAVNTRFQNSLGLESLDVNFSVKVLTRGHWPLKDFVHFTLPSVLERSMILFTTFYVKEHNDRRLIWLHNMSRGELVTHCFESKHTFLASTYQIAVLMQFNMNLVYTVRQLQSITMIPLDILIKVVKQLLKVKLLKFEDKTVKVTVDTKLNLFLDFKNTKLRLNIDVPLNLETKKEQEQTNKSVDNSRRLIIEATTVRIMKTRMTLQHNLLIAQICKQTNSLFKADIPMIKRTIESLIDREYIERGKEDRKMLYYIA